MNTRELALRTAKARLNAGHHQPPPPSFEEFSRQIMQATMGTVTNAELATMYAEETEEWADVLALPGVTTTDDGCAELTEAADWAKSGGFDPHAAANTPDGMVPDTVEALLASANQAPEQGNNEPVFALVLTPMGGLPIPGGQAYAIQVIDSREVPRADVISTLRGIADRMEQDSEHGN